MAASVDEYLKAAVEVAKKASEVINDALHKEKLITTKDGMSDLVTETDQQVEKLIIGTLKERFPTHSFIGEESVAAGEKCVFTDNPTWIIDPIDGTTNFIHRYPYFAVSIGLAINKELAVGVVYNVAMNELYTAVKGKGAFLNGKKIQTTKEKEIGKALVITELGSNREKTRLDILMRNYRRLAEEPNAVHSIRLQGSAACNICTVANGVADAYYEFGIHCWDIAAGILILTEAGGVATNLEGGPCDIMSRFVMAASTKELASAVCQQLERIDCPSD
ncbi:inositol monophosphatase 1-like isoform X1 [Actinia tenebrosa]|uniref:Inositol-1-monophosphatase n=1 Tax=Actinia tenebrosa TaxID=6105 RepID=A0A6P8I709_ACTTE|nr:inositol monophosphatase 1-like isoform X1 [Actinia tenebrosa]XP_031560515.1 inositol monophosphatase 1-like isoform X1 [Actinia tenebrosa]XP_031560516.1 inositol monophosphatase 1-like isoform X1 [Actinia tenebrosa]